MSDISLRKSERVGGPRLVLERFRSGLISEHRLLLASALGHSVARELRPEAEEVNWLNFDERQKFLLNVPVSVVLQAVADFSEWVLPIFEKKYPNDTNPGEAIQAAREVRLGVSAAACIFSAGRAAVAYSISRSASDSSRNSCNGIYAAIARSASSVALCAYYAFNDRGPSFRFSTSASSVCADVSFHGTGSYERQKSHLANILLGIEHE